MRSFNRLDCGICVKSGPAYNKVATMRLISAASEQFGSGSAIHVSIVPGADPNAIDYSLDGVLQSMLSKIRGENDPHEKRRIEHWDHPLHLMSKAKFPNMSRAVHSMVNHGAIVDALNSVGQTALQIACMSGQELMIKALLTAGADVNASAATDRSTPLHYALWRSRDNKDAMMILLHAGADPNRQDRNGQTALHVAMSNPGLDVDIVKELLQYGADPGIRDNDGKIPRKLAGRSKADRAKVALLRAFEARQALERMAATLTAAPRT